MVASPHRTQAWDELLKELQPQLKSTTSATSLLSTINGTLKAKGIEGNPSTPPFRPGGTQDWVFALLGQEAMTGIVVLATPSGSGYSLEVLMPLTADSMMPTNGFAWQKEFVFGGLDGWLGNGPAGAAIVLAKGPQGWKKTQSVSTDFEAWECQFKRQGNRWVANVAGRTYPKNINVAHVMSNVEMSQQFMFSNGRLSVGQPKRTMNPMAVLDDLAGAAAKHQIAAIRKNCINDTLAKQVNALGNGLKDSGWSTPSNTTSVRDTDYIATSLGLRFVFTRRSGRWVLSALKSAPKSN